MEWWDSLEILRDVGFAGRKDSKESFGFGIILLALMTAVFGLGVIWLAFLMAAVFGFGAALSLLLPSMKQGGKDSLTGSFGAGATSLPVSQLLLLEHLLDLESEDSEEEGESESDESSRKFFSL
jgi:hypothetical protein